MKLELDLDEVEARNTIHALSVEGRRLAEIWKRDRDPAVHAEIKRLDKVRHALECEVDDNASRD